MIQYFPDAPTDHMVQDAIDEYNRQGEPDAEALSITGFGTKVLTITPADRGNPLVLFSHGLGYAPLFQVFFGSTTNQGIFPVPVVDASQDGAGNLLFGGTINAYADVANLYIIYNDQLPTNQQTFTYVLFNGPIAGS